ncbi:hypothetical protein [Ignatzschineria sp. LJL83]
MSKQVQKKPFSHYFGHSFLYVGISGLILLYFLLSEPSALWYVMIPFIVISVIFFSIISLIIAASVYEANTLKDLTKYGAIISGVISLFILMLMLVNQVNKIEAFFIFLAIFSVLFLYVFTIQFIVFNIMKK